MRIIQTSQGKVSMNVTGNGHDLLLLHSLLTDSAAFADLVPRLAGQWRVSTVDLPGYGETSTCGPSIDEYADAIAALLGDGSYDPRNTALVGNGLGGFVALGVAVRNGSLFDRLLLLGCGTGFSSESRMNFERMAARVAEGGMAAIIDVALRRIFTEDHLASHPDQARQRSEVLRRINPDSFINGCKALATVDYSGGVGSVHNSTLIVTGSRDEATPPSMGRSLAQLIPAATFRELPDVAHAPHLQSPDTLIDAIAEFLDLKAITQ